MPVSMTILGSGSGGNCLYLETENIRILVDAGFSGRQISQRLATIGRAPEMLDAVLVTHEHTDHIKGLRTLCPKHRLPVYCNRLTAEAIEAYLQQGFECRLFGTGASFELGDLTVESFSIPHDAQDPVGFLVHTPHSRIGICTDLGYASRLVMEKVRPANVLLLETNYDLQMLQDDRRRPWSLKQRIASRHGHLSNEEAARMTGLIVEDHLKHLFLSHLSRDCNTPDLARRSVSQCLDELGACHVQVATARQDVPAPTLVLDSMNGTLFGP